MGESGTLVLARSEPPERSKYSVALAVPGQPHSQMSVYHCYSDLRLLRALEDLIQATDVRLGALERLYKEGHAAISDVELPEELLEEYGLAGRRQAETLREPVRLGGAARASLCIVCRQPISGTRDVVIGPGRAVHDGCHSRRYDVEDSAVQFLRGTPGKQFCRTCLANLFQIEFDQARTLVAHLRRWTGFELGTGTCYGCHHLRMTVRAKPSEP